MPEISEESEPERQLTGIPAQITVRVLVGSQLVADLTAERPSEIEARVFCQELVLQIEALLQQRHYAH